jgi:hypothetical protein
MQQSIIIQPGNVEEMVNLQQYLEKARTSEMKILDENVDDAKKR